MTDKRKAGKKPAKVNSAVKNEKPDVNVFIAEYLVDRNGRRAAVVAGYSEKTAASQSSRLLKRVDIAAQIDSARTAHVAKLQIETGITLEKVLRELAVLAFCPLEDIRGMGLDKTRALDMLMKHLGGYEANNLQAGESAANVLAGLAVRFVEAKT